MGLKNTGDRQIKAVKPMVSVIVPIYEVEKFLQQCINSICEQTYTRLEIILIDDGSPDQCAEICDKNAMKDPRIVVVHKKNGGLSSARNAGIDIATGDYISFVDADDTIHPKFIETLINLCEQYDCDIAQCDFLAITELSQKLPLNPQQSIKFYSGRQALHNLCIGSNILKYTTIWNKIYKRELFSEIRFPFGKINEDEFVNYLLLWKARRVADINQYMYYYLRHTASIMGQPFSIRHLDSLNALKERSIFLKKNGLEEEYTAVLHRLYHLIKKDVILLKENLEDSEMICTKLRNEAKNIEKEIPEVLEKVSEEPLIHDQIMETCSYSKEAKIVLYGAGKWGRIYYQWIKEHQQGTVVGWVDNLWFLKDEIDYPIKPLDFLLRAVYDYILITIKSKNVQEEVKKNLIGWGIQKEKIRMIFTNEG